MTSTGPPTTNPHGHAEKPSPPLRATNASYEETVERLESAAAERRETVREVLGALRIKAFIDRTT